ncbi:4300_t:CDS:2 [Funneliformis geosporum]|nr:4300_t:CDS:2 [Funneliformis geosporum]
MDEEKSPLYFRSQNIYSENSEDDFKEDPDKESNTINKLSELEIFEFNENNYINTDEDDKDFDAYKSDYENQEVPLPPSLPVEETNDPVCKLNPTIRTNFSLCILVDYIDDKLHTCGQTANVRNICQLVETWQIDENAILEY